MVIIIQRVGGVFRERRIFMANDMVLTVGELAMYLRVHKSTVYRQLKKKRIPAFRIGSDWRFRFSEVDRWLQLLKDEQVSEASSCNRSPVSGIR
jgi:excisionase family DNA binding protein